jgi:hypothetical protein
MSLFVKGPVTDKELIQNIKSISQKLPFEKLFLLSKSDIVNVRKLLKTENIMYKGKPLSNDKKQYIEKILQDDEIVKNLIVRDKKEYAKKLDNFVQRQKSPSKSPSNSTRNSTQNSTRNSTRNSRQKSLSNSTRSPKLQVTRQKLAELVGGAYERYRLDFDDDVMGMTQSIVKEFVKNYNYTDFLLTNRTLILDINLESYMLYGYIMDRTNGNHEVASRIVFLFRASLAFRIAFVNILVVGFLYLTYRNKDYVDPQKLLKPIKTLIYYVLS